MKEHLVQWAVMAFSGLGGLGLVLWALKKWGPGLVDKFLGGAVRSAMDFDEGDPVKNAARKKMILANMVYLELQIPDRGKGPERRARILATFGEKAGPIVDELVSQIDEELKKLTAGQ